MPAMVMLCVSVGGQQHGDMT